MKWKKGEMARRVEVAAGCSTGRVKALRVVLLVLQQFSAALLVRAIFPLLGSSTVKVPFPSLIVAAAEATEDPERAAAAAAADYSSSRAITNKDRLAGNAAFSTGRAASGGEGTAVLDRREATRARATTDDATGAREQDAGYNEAAMRTARNHVTGQGAIETGETKERAAAGVGGWIAQGVAAPGGGTLNGTATQGGPAVLDGEAAEPWSNRAAGLTQGRTPALEPADVEAAASPKSTDLSFADARSSSPALSGTTYATSPTRKPAAGLKRTTIGAFDRTARLSPLAAAAFERAAAASAPVATTAAALGDRSPSGGPPIRFTSLKRGGAAALERAAAAAAARAGTGSSRASSPKVFSEDARGSSKKVSAGVSAPADAAGASSTESDAAGGAVPLTPAAATPSRSAASPSRPPSPAPHSAPAPALAVENISSFAAALLTGTVRRLAFERCDRYTQKVAITASPGDTVVAECQGAARTIPTDIQSFCCRGGCGRCTTKSAVSYNTLYRTGSIPHFRYAAGDGIRSAWRLKIPESLQPPYPTFSVAWLGPAALDIPIEATAGATGVPTATLVIHIEAPRQPDDRLALLRSPGAAAECLLDEPPKKEDDMFTDEERREESGRLYERTLFGLRRVSQAPAAAAPRCALHLTVRNNGSCVRDLLHLLELLRCVPWNVVLSAVITGSMAFWA